MFYRFHVEVGTREGGGSSGSSSKRFALFFLALYRAELREEMGRPKASGKKIRDACVQALNFVKE